METLDPGTSATVSFTVGGLSKGDWSDLDIFFRGAGDIIGATKIDEEILAEMLREEDAGVEQEDVIGEESPGDIGDDIPVESNVESMDDPPDEIVEQEEVVAEPQEGWFGVGRGEEE